MLLLAMHVVIVHTSESAGSKGGQKMLKFVDAEGNVKYILLDEDKKPREVKEIAKRILEKAGLYVEEDEDEKKLQGVSQDDMRYVRGE